MKEGLFAYFISLELKNASEKFTSVKIRNFFETEIASNYITRGGLEITESFPIKVLYRY